ncbi:MAG: hypothetical protein JXQ75_21755, partial [Phycisphaerae bacterium]|nr:hypothetical protein [Phycisphaerae bacterium]
MTLGRPARFRTRVVFALALGAAFVWMNLGDLPVNFQIDGQVPEYLAWATAPDASGASLNPELNKHLYSVYYPVLGRFARSMTRMDLLRLVYALEILAVSAAIYFFVTMLTGDRWAALLAVAAAVWHSAASVAVGGSGGIGLICGPLYPATAMALVALALSWRRQHVAAAFVAGLAFNVHGSSALFVSTMILFAAWVDGKWRIVDTRVIFAALVCLCAAAPTVAWILTNPPPPASMSTADWMRFPRWIYPLHMIVSSTPILAWTTLFVFVLPGVLGLASRRRDLRTQMPTLQGWILGAGLLLTAGYVFVEWIPVRPIAQLTLWRGTQYLVFLCLAFGLSYLVQCIRHGGLAAVAAAMLLVAYVTPRHPELAWISHLGLIGLLVLTARRVRGLDRALTVTAALAACGVVLYELSFLSRLGEHLYWRWPLIVVGLAALLLWAGRSQAWYRQVTALCGMVAVAFWLAELGVSKHFPDKYRRRAAALLDLAPAIETACPPGEIVIAPPDLRNPGAWANRGSFLCRQQLTAYAYGPWLAEKILDRMQWYLDTPIELAPTDSSILPRLSEGFRTRGSGDFAELRERYGVRLAIVDRDKT